MFKKKIKGFYFGHSYLFSKPENAEINFDKLQDKENDSNKIEKHAILSVLYGNIWKKPYTNNPFPYLAQPFLSLTI